MHDWGFLTGRTVKKLGIALLIQTCRLLARTAIDDGAPVPPSLPSREPLYYKQQQRTLHAAAPPAGH
jgi:hypothetical protein